MGKLTIEDIVNVYDIIVSELDYSTKYFEITKNYSTNSIYEFCEENNENALCKYTLRAVSRLEDYMKDSYKDYMAYVRQTRALYRGSIIKELRLNKENSE